MNINKYIDWKAIFCELIQEHKAEMQDAINNKEENYEIFRSIINFYALDMNDGFEIQYEECDINDALIHFCFLMGHNDTNESTSYESSTIVTIIFGRNGEKFISYQHES